MNKEEPKQVIVMRKDLNMRKGKMVAQGSHASMKAVIDWGNFEDTKTGLDFCISDIDQNEALVEWLEGRFTKVCVSVDSEEELMDVYNNAVAAGIKCVSLITDAGLTEFNGVPTVTCCAIGPAYPSEINPITGHLKLL